MAQLEPAGDVDIVLKSTWRIVSDRVRRAIETPTVWLAMAESTPVVIEGNQFVVALPKEHYYLAYHLQTHDIVHEIEQALRDVAGHPLVFTLFEGSSLADWQAQKQINAASGQPGVMASSIASAITAPTFQTPDTSEDGLPSWADADLSWDAGAATWDTPNEGLSAPRPSARPVSAPRNREVCQTWDQVIDKAVVGYKKAPFVRFPHGQARFLLHCVENLSDTMDLLMPPPGQPADLNQERLMSRAIERVASVFSLDPIFLSLELWRYRQSQGLNIDNDE